MNPTIISIVETIVGLMLIWFRWWRSWRWFQIPECYSTRRITNKGPCWVLWRWWLCIHTGSFSSICLQEYKSPERKRLDRRTHEGYFCWVHNIQQPA